MSCWRRRCDKDDKQPLGLSWTSIEDQPHFVWGGEQQPGHLSAALTFIASRVRDDNRIAHHEPLTDPLEEGE